MLRTIAVVVALLSPAARTQVFSSPAAAAADQEITLIHRPDGQARHDYVVWAWFSGTDGPFRDNAPYLADLQTRWRDKQVAFGALLPKEAAQELAETRPRYLVATLDAPAPARANQAVGVYVYDDNGRVVYQTNTLDGIADVVQDCVAGTLAPQERQQSHAGLQSMLFNITDGGEFDQQVAQCLKDWPHSGRAHACAVLNQWWCKGDLEAARKAADEGIRALGLESAPMTVFADLVLRGDRNDVEVARRLAMAMAPVAAGARDGVFTQLVHLRALLRAGQDRLAGRIAATLPKQLGNDAQQNLIFAETLMEGATPMAFRDLAEQSLKRAEQNDGNRQWLYGARHKLLTRCGDDQAAAELMLGYRKKRVSSSTLNNDAWYLIVRPESMGRFDTLALAQAQEMERLEGDGIDYGSKDTVALAYFVNGYFDKAVELQDEATKGSNGSPAYVGRLTRYRATRKMLADRKDGSDKDGK